MVLRNVAKTFSLEEQRQEINEIAVDLDAVNTTLTNWNAANWDTAYSWGDHALAGYLTAETDPVFGASEAASITSTDTSNWDTAYGWGNHSSAGYLVNGTLSATVYRGSGEFRIIAGGSQTTRPHIHLKNSTSLDLDILGASGTATGGVTIDSRGAGTVSIKDGGTTRLETSDTGVTITGDISVSGTVDGRDVATDGTKLDGIESGATADQTATEIKTAYESNADTNAFTDAEQTKLAGIAAGAEVNLDPGGTFSGAGTTADPAIGSIQFKNTGNTFGGDSGFLWNNTYNHLIVNGPSNSKDYTLSGGIFVQPGSGKSGLTITSSTATDNAYINFSGGTASSAEQFAFAIGRDGTNGTGMVKIADTTVAEFDSDGIKMAATKGIKFSPYGSGNVLDSYQEGEFTPAITAPGAGDPALTLNASINTLRYIKIGRMVTIFGRIKIDSLNGQSGNLYLTNLPFDADNTGNGQSNYNALTVTTHGVAYVANATGHCFVELTPGQNYGAIFFERDNDGWTSVTTAELNFTPGCYMYFHGSYYADA